MGCSGICRGKAPVSGSKHYPMSEDTIITGAIATRARVGLGTKQTRSSPAGARSTTLLCSIMQKRTPSSCPRRTLTGTTPPPTLRGLRSLRTGRNPRQPWHSGPPRRAVSIALRPRAPLPLLLHRRDSPGIAAAAAPAARGPFLGHPLVRERSCDAHNYTCSVSLLKV